MEALGFFNEHLFRLYLNIMKKKVIQIIVISICIFYLGNFIADNWQEIQTFNWNINYFFLALSFICGLGVPVLAIFGWDVIVRATGVQLSFNNNMRIWVASMMGKYVPGKVAVTIGRVYLGNKFGASKVKMLISIFLEVVLMQIAGIIVFLTSLPFWNFSMSNSLFAAVLIFVFFGTITIYSGVLESIVNYGMKILKKETIQTKIKLKNKLLVLLIYILVWILNGIFCYFFIKSFYNVDLSKFIMIVGIWTISTIIGVLSFVIPGGIGVREGILVSLLSLVLPPSVAVIIAIFSRIWQIIIELSLIGIVLRYDVSLSK